MGPIVVFFVKQMVTSGVSYLFEKEFGSREHREQMKLVQQQQQRALEEFARAKEKMLSEYLLQNQKAIMNEASDQFYLERFYDVWEDIKENFIYSFLFFWFIVIVLYEILKYYNNKE